MIELGTLSINFLDRYWFIDMDRIRVLKTIVFQYQLYFYTGGGGNKGVPRN